jgi:hypothetical protein
MTTNFAFIQLILTNHTLDEYRVRFDSLSKQRSRRKRRLIEERFSTGVFLYSPYFQTSSNASSNGTLKLNWQFLVVHFPTLRFHISEEITNRALLQI